MQESHYSNHNLAGILSEAFGLEGGRGRASFSGSHRESIRSALDDDSAPETFAELLAVLRRMEASAATIRAVEGLAADQPSRRLQEFAVSYGRGEG